jgi:protein-tyrosine-phosphatase/DNA-binding transcriptional ArsR family regulator
MTTGHRGKASGRLSGRTDIERRAKLHAALGEPVRLKIVDELVLRDASPGELRDLVDLPTNLLAHHLKVLDEAGLIRRVRSEGDRRRSYVQLTLDDPAVSALVTAHAPTPPPAERVVFVCTHNSARSQFAAATWATTSGVPVASAGTHPAARVHPRAVRVGRRHGLSLRGAGTAHVDDIVRTGDLVVAVCDNAHEELPDLPKLHWSVPDPAPADTDDAFEAAYEAITERVERLAHALAATSPTPPRAPAR